MNIEINLKFATDDHGAVGHIFRGVHEVLDENGIDEPKSEGRDGDTSRMSLPFENRPVDLPGCQKYPYATPNEFPFFSMSLSGMSREHSDALDLSLCETSEGVSLVGWDAVNRWGHLSSPIWHVAFRRAECAGLNEVDVLKCVAATMLKEYARVSRALIDAQEKATRSYILNNPPL